MCLFFAPFADVHGIAVHRFRQVQQRVRLLRRQRLRGRGPGVHILRGAHKRRLPGAQRLRVPGQRARRRENTPGRVPLRPAVHAPPPPAPDALAVLPVRFLRHARPVPRRRQALGIRADLQHGPEYVFSIYIVLRAPDVDRAFRDGSTSAQRTMYNNIIYYIGSIRIIIIIFFLFFNLMFSIHFMVLCCDEILFKYIFRLLEL